MNVLVRYDSDVTLWAVGDGPALSFTKAFYEALLSGKTLAASSIAARHAAQAAQEATWLAYAVYGHPRAKLQRVDA